MTSWTLIFLGWFVSCIATFGSLFFSEVMEFSPCILCWYQRILMYPLVIILLVGMLRQNKEVFFYSFPLSFLGLLLAFYHLLIQHGVIPETASPCREGLSCADTWINWLGFITIPLLSFVAFTLISTILFFYNKKS